MLKFIDFSGELRGIVEGNQVLLEFLLKQCSLVWVVGEINICRKGTRIL